MYSPIEVSFSPQSRFIHETKPQIPQFGKIPLFPPHLQYPAFPNFEWYHPYLVYELRVVFTNPLRTSSGEQFINSV